MKKISHLLSVGLLLPALLWCSTVAHAQENAPVEVAVVPASVEVVAGQSVDLAVEVRDVEELYGVDVSLSFDPAIVTVVDANPNADGVQVAFGTFMDQGFVVRNSVDNEAGTLQFVMTQVNPSEPKSGTGTIIVIKLRGREIGATTPIRLESAYLAQPDGTELPTDLISGQVQVVASASVGPTNTPIPTQPPGTPLPTSTPTPAPATPTPTSTATSSPRPPTASPTQTPPMPTPSPTETTRPATNTPQPTSTSAETETLSGEANPSPSPTLRSVTGVPTLERTSEPSSTPTPPALDETEQPKATPTIKAKNDGDLGTSRANEGGSSYGPTKRKLLYIALGAAGAAIVLLGVPAVQILRDRPRSRAN